MTPPDPAPMTPEERTEKVLRWLWDRGYSPAIGFSELCIAQIREAEDRAIQKFLLGEDNLAAIKAAHAGGFNAAREKAAKLIESRKGIPEHHKDLADLIREMRDDD